jgi:hypothetical protein
MSTKAGTLGFSERPALFTFWTVAVSALAAAALILSAVALNVAGRDVRSVTSVEGSGTSIGATLWDAGKLEAMRGRVLAEAVRTQQALWDAGKIEALKGRVLAESVGIQDYAPLWDAGKIEAMKGRVLAESAGIQGYAPLWDAGKIEAMKGRVLAG